MLIILKYCWSHSTSRWMMNEVMGHKYVSLTSTFQASSLSLSPPFLKKLFKFSGKAKQTKCTKTKRSTLMHPGQATKQRFLLFSFSFTMINASNLSIYLHVCILHYYIICIASVTLTNFILKHLKNRKPNLGKRYVANLCSYVSCRLNFNCVSCS